MKKLLLVCSRNLKIVAPLKKEMADLGVELAWFDTHRNHWFDRFVIHVANKLAHNLRLIPKNRFLFTDHPLSHFNYRNSGLIECYEAFRPDGVIMVRGLRFSNETIEYLAERCPVVGWYIESESFFRQVEPEISGFFRYFFISPLAVDYFCAKGVGKVNLLRHSVDPGMFYPMDIEKQYDWCFVGNWSRERQEIVEEALKVSSNGIVFGANWFKNNLNNFSVIRLVGGKSIYGQALTEIYNRTRIVLNVTAWGHGSTGKKTGVNMRVLEVPACRTLLLTDSTDDLAEIVEPGLHVVSYDSLPDFREKLARYLANDEARRAIADEGYNWVRSRFSYRDIAKTFMEACGLVQENVFR